MSYKKDIITRVKRRLGWPLIKIELTDAQISDNLDMARQKFIKWAAGNATQEVYFTMMLSGGKSEYDLPAGVVSVVDYEKGATSFGGINTLFTMENYMYNNGMLDGLLMRGATYDLVSYHLAKQFLDTLKRYIVDKYTYRYNKYRNILEVSPPPPCDKQMTVTSQAACGQDAVTYTVNSPGFVLLRTFMIAGATLDKPGQWNKQDQYFSTPTSATSIDNQWDDLYNSDWVFDYTLALSKIVLGTVRRKFASFQSLGNTGIAMDGEALVQEGIADRDKLDEKLRLEESEEGMPVLIS